MGVTGVSFPENCTRNEDQSLKDTVSISKAGKNAENEYETMQGYIGISQASKIAENEYESMRDIIGISKANVEIQYEFRTDCVVQVHTSLEQVQSSVPCRKNE